MNKLSNIDENWRQEFDNNLKESIQVLQLLPQSAEVKKLWENLLHASNMRREKLDSLYWFKSKNSELKDLGQL